LSLFASSWQLGRRLEIKRRGVFAGIGDFFTA